MKNFRFMAMLLLAAMCVFAACSSDGGGDSGDTDGDRAPVNFISAAQTGGSSGTADSTALTLTFDADPATLTVDNISVYGATKVALTGSGTTRSLSITNITVINGAPVYVAISNPSGYAISGSPRTAAIYRAPASVTFQSAVQTGGSPCSADSTSLTLTFDTDPTTLSADDITVTGATKGMLTGSGTTRSLAISNITVGNGATVSVAITSPYGYSMSGSPVTAVVYRAAYIGMEYGGGKIAYIFQSGDTGYVAGEVHGLIVATEDQSTGIQWGSYSGSLGSAIGTGSANTDLLIAYNGSGTGYAAGLARAYNGGGYTDWYLPTRSDCNRIWANKSKNGGPTGNLYWTSSCYSSTEPVMFSFSDGNDYTPAASNLYYVRAVRNF